LRKRLNVLDDSVVQGLRQAQIEARARLKTQLSRYGLSDIPLKSDPDARAVSAWDDASVVEAVRVYRNISSRLEFHRNYPTLKDEYLRRGKFYRDANRVSCALRYRRYKDAHPWKAAEWSRRRRARLLGVTSTYDEAVDREFLEATQKGRCAYCGKLEDEVGGFVVEHMTPVSRGGSDVLDNVVLACSGCNAVKSDKTPDEYITYISLLYGEEVAGAVRIRLLDVLEIRALVLREIEAELKEVRSG